MHKFKFAPRQKKNLIVSVGMAAIMAVPMFAQPLGLALAATESVANASIAQNIALYDIETKSPEFPESLADLDIAMNRSSGTDAVLTNHEANRNVLMALATPTTVSPYTVYVTGSVNFRTGAGTNYSVIDVLRLGAKLTVTGETTGWKRVKDAAGRTGYVSAGYLSRNMVFVSTNDTVQMLKSGVNLRQAPTTSSAILGLLSAGTRLTRTGIGDGWTRVRTANGTVGYVASYFLTTQLEANRDVVLTMSTPTTVSPYTVYVTGSVNFRTGPGTDSSVIDVLRLGAKLTVTGETTGWKRVKDAAGRTGYVSENYLSRNMVFVSTNDTVYMLKSSVNLRQAPTTESTSLGLLSAGTRLTRTGIGDGWTRVTTEKGTVGYVASYFLTTNAPATASSTSGVSASIAKVVDTAHSMLGVPYVWAAESRSGVDCSGLTYYCYQQIGITLPRVSASQATFGTSVSYANMKPGDIIALDTNLNDGKTATNHVGLYIGNGEMIHASSSQGKVVKANVANYIKYSKITSIRRIVN